MKKYAVEILMGLILALTLQLVLRERPSAQVPEPVMAASAAQAAEGSFDEAYMLTLLREDETERCSLQEYLVGVLLSEVPMSFAGEALKAQAIASRTFTLHCRKHDGADVCADSGCCQAWGDVQSLQERFGEKYEEYYEKALQAVEATDGMVLTYHGDLIDATFFACSGGTTEAAEAVWGNDIPYLQSADSPGEEIADCYESQCEFSPEEFAEALPEADLSGDPDVWVGETTKTQGDGVDTMSIGGISYKGTELRRRFGLRSAKFTLCYENGSFCFHVLGYGHRVGMSQWGAEAMARKGAKAEEILAAYYTDTVCEALHASQAIYLHRPYRAAHPDISA